MKKSNLKTEIKKLVQDCIESSTSHGFPNIVRNENLFIKVLWSLCLVVSFGYCVYNLKNSFDDYFSYEVNTKITKERMSSIEFPTITFCNKIPFDNLKIFPIVKKGFKDLKNESLQYFNKTQNTFDIMLKIEYELAYRALQFKSGIKNFEHFMLPKFGNCYKFNSGKNSNGESVKLLNTTIPGVQYGLKLEIFTGYPSNEFDLIRTNGVHLFIHNSSTIPFSDFDGISIPNGFETNVVVSQIHSSKLSQPFSNCIEDPTSKSSFDSNLYRRSIELFSKYQQKTCLVLCYDEYIQNVCGCSRPEAFGISINESCELTKMNCTLNAYRSFYETQLSLECYKSCPVECFTIDYDYKVSQADFPSPFYADVLIEHGKLYPNYARNFINYDQIKKSVLAVNIYFDDVSISFLKDNEAKSVNQLVADIGGFMG
ncbi:unnamed protein product, partial [Brachionus calyciflorus]